MKKTRAIILLVAAFTFLLSFALAGCTNNDTAQNEINVLIKEQDEAINNRDLEALLSCYAPSARDSIVDIASQIIDTYAGLDATITTTIDEYDISGNNATLKVTVTISALGAENSSPSAISCISEGNDWYLII